MLGKLAISFILDLDSSCLKVIPIAYLVPYNHTQVGIFFNYCENDGQFPTSQTPMS